MDAVREKHRGLIDGFTTLYKLLVKMQYLSPSHISYPPHTSPAVDISLLQSLGFEEGVIQLTQALPNIRPEVTWGWERRATQISPESMALTYLDSKGFAEGLDVERLRAANAYYDEDDLLPPWVLRLSFGGSYGLHLLYNTKDASITEASWANGNNKRWDSFPTRPAHIAMAEMIDKFRNLEWVPLYDPTTGSEREPASREIVGNPLTMNNMRDFAYLLPEDNFPVALEMVQQIISPSGSHSGKMLRQQYNRWLALQKLYRDAGWHSDYDADDFIFDVEAFERERLKLLTTEKGLRGDMMDKQGARPPEERVLDIIKENPDMVRIIREEQHGSTVFLQTDEQKTLAMEAEKKWEDFWVEKAGPEAV